ncbi:MAG TPA: hypothetical protein VIG88_12925 [Lysobacter sp.]
MFDSIRLAMATMPPTWLLLVGLVYGFVLGELLRVLWSIAVYVFRRLTNRCTCCGTPLCTGEIDHDPNA